MPGQETPLDILKKFWKANTFRFPQEEIITAVSQKKDVVALLPTGFGKSICYQIPTLMQDGMCLVITPLIALMLDQVENLRVKDIPAIAIHSGMPIKDIKRHLENALYDRYKFLYVSPERLNDKLFQAYLPDLPIQLIAVDEAHCISQWGYDFRPAYLDIGRLRETLPQVPVIGLTASATPEVMNDIADKLLLHNPAIFTTSFTRPNISYSSFLVDNKLNKLLSILTNVAGSGIVYCKTRKTAHQIATLLQEQSISADYYHAGLSQDQRDEKQSLWKKGKIRIICCTNAFGMGIDKQNVRLVVHYDSPDVLESYYQEAGRAGRDGKKAYAVLLYTKKDLENFRLLPEQQYPSLKKIKQVFQAIVDYLAIPVHAGGNTYFSFDINDFCKKFKQGIVETVQVLKALEQEGHLSFSTAVFIPSQVIFRASREWIQSFEKEFPRLEPLIKSLLRTYDGIFDNQVAINENQLAKILKQSLPDVLKGLQQLHGYGILEYYPMKDTPQIYFAWDRAPAAHLRFDENRYARLKKSYQKRVAVMQSYLVLESTCRSKYIAAYFGDTTGADCQICDTCLQHKQTGLTQKDFLEIREKIFACIPAVGIPVKELMAARSGSQQKKYWQVLEFLQAEGILTMKDDGRIIRNK